MSGRYHQLMQRQRVILDLDQEVAALLAACAADAHVSEGEIVERAVRAMDLRALVARIRERSDLDEDEAMRLVQEELRAARMALEIQAAFMPLHTRWLKSGHDLDLGIGMAQGFATLGAFGFEGRWDYSAIGGVVNLAARLCDEAKGGQILINRRMRAALDDAAETLPAGPMSLKGFAQPVEVFILAAMAS